MIRHCVPGCRSCEAAERVLRLSAVFEDIGDAEIADALMDIAMQVGRKTPTGRRMVSALLDPTT